MKTCSHNGEPYYYDVCRCSHIVKNRIGSVNQSCQPGLQSSAMTGIAYKNDQVKHVVLGSALSPWGQLEHDKPSKSAPFGAVRGSRSPARQQRNVWHTPEGVCHQRSSQGVTRTRRCMPLNNFSEAGHTPKGVCHKDTAANAGKYPKVVPQKSGQVAARHRTCVQWAQNHGRPSVAGQREPA